MATKIKPHDVFRMKDGSKVVVIHAAKGKILFAPTFNQSRMSEWPATKFIGQIAEELPKLGEHQRRLEEALSRSPSADERTTFREHMRHQPNKSD